MGGVNSIHYQPEYAYKLFSPNTMNLNKCFVLEAVVMNQFYSTTAQEQENVSKLLFTTLALLFYL
jgi:hypothetical protein